MAKETYLGLDIVYEYDNDGNVALDQTFDRDGVLISEKVKVSHMICVRNFSDWMDLDVRDLDDYVMTVRGPIRMPTIVVCATFGKMLSNRVIFPTNRNIFKRDNYTCAYTGKKLQKSELSVDHILPKSRGGKNTWENLVTCDKTVNCEKADRTPDEAGLKLQIKPKKPSNGMVFEVLRDEWKVFIDSVK
jgi:hypothetical protein